MSVVGLPPTTNRHAASPMQLAIGSIGLHPFLHVDIFIRAACISCGSSNSSFEPASARSSRTTECTEEKRPWLVAGICYVIMRALSRRTSFSISRQQEPRKPMEKVDTRTDNVQGKLSTLPRGSMNNIHFQFAMIQSSG